MHGPDSVDSDQRTQNGGDYSEWVDCPLCGIEVINTRLPRHMNGEACNGGGDDV
jgi:hypothetical protein